jgi:hypothetical protein
VPVDESSGLSPKATGQDLRRCGSRSCLRAAAPKRRARRTSTASKTFIICDVVASNSSTAPKDASAPRRLAKMAYNAHLIYECGNRSNARRLPSVLRPPTAKLVCSKKSATAPIAMPVTRSPSREKLQAQRRNARAVIKQRLEIESSGKPAGDARGGQEGGGEGKTHEKETPEAFGDAAAIPGVHDDSIANLPPTATASPETQLGSIMPSKGAGAGGGVSIQGSELPIFGGSKTAGKYPPPSFDATALSHCYPRRSASRAKARSPTRGAANLRHAPAGRQRRNQRGSG